MYLSLHPLIGAQAANFVSMLIAAVLNTGANRAFTFGVRGRDGAAGHPGTARAVGVERPGGPRPPAATGRARRLAGVDLAPLISRGEIDHSRTAAITAAFRDRLLSVECGA